MRSHTGDERLVLLNKCVIRRANESEIHTLTTWCLIKHHKFEENTNQTSKYIIYGTWDIVCAIYGIKFKNKNKRADPLPVLDKRQGAFHFIYIYIRK